jgi:hypothetical protein
MPSKFFYCRECGGFTGFRSRPRSFTEKYLLPLMFHRPVRCGNCFRRSYQSVFVPVRERPQPKKARGAAA